MNNKIKGNLGEKIAQDFLIKNKFKILETNFRYSKLAEIDIIAQKNNTIHFIEVKTRTSNISGNPLEAITKTKLNSIYSCAKFYLSNTKNHYDNMQIDAIAIILNETQEPKIEFIENISLN